VQGKINVVVGCVYPKFNKETVAASFRDSPFFSDFLGLCGNVSYSGNSNAPYASKERQALGLDAAESTLARKRTKVLPIQFYKALVEAIACPPHLKGCTFVTVSASTLFQFAACACLTKSTHVVVIGSRRTAYCRHLRV
jgi:hypothetical protein